MIKDYVGAVNIQKLCEALGVSSPEEIDVSLCQMDGFTVVKFDFENVYYVPKK